MAVLLYLVLSSLSLRSLVDAYSENVVPVGVTNFTSFLLMPPAKRFSPDGASVRQSFATPAIIFFYAPWCGHCKAQRPLFESAADAAALLNLRDKVIFAEVDCTRSDRLCASANVVGFPTIKYTAPSELSLLYPDPAAHPEKSLLAYSSQRTPEAFLALAVKLAETVNFKVSDRVPPSVWPLTATSSGGCPSLRDVPVPKPVVVFTWGHDAVALLRAARVSLLSYSHAMDFHAFTSAAVSSDLACVPLRDAASFADAAAACGRRGVGHTGTDTGTCIGVLTDGGVLTVFPLTPSQRRRQPRSEFVDLSPSRVAVPPGEPAAVYAEAVEWAVEAALPTVSELTLANFRSFVDAADKMGVPLALLCLPGNTDPSSHSKESKDHLRALTALSETVAAIASRDASPKAVATAQDGSGTAGHEPNVILDSFIFVWVNMTYWQDYFVRRFSVDGRAEIGASGPFVLIWDYEVEYFWTSTRLKSNPTADREAIHRATVAASSLWTVQAADSGEASPLNLELYLDAVASGALQAEYCSYAALFLQPVRRFRLAVRSWYRSHFQTTDRSLFGLSLIKPLNPFAIVLTSIVVLMVVGVPVSFCLFCCVPPSKLRRPKQKET